MFRDIKDWLRACETCQKVKPGIKRGQEELKHEDIDGPSIRAAMDLAVMPITRQGYRYLLVYQDYYSKFIEFFPQVEKTLRALAHELVMKIFTRYGMCVELHSDQGKEFRWKAHPQLVPSEGYQKDQDLQLHSLV